MPRYGRVKRSLRCLTFINSAQTISPETAPLTGVYVVHRLFQALSFARIVQSETQCTRNFTPKIEVLMSTTRRGRPKKFSEFDDLVASCPRDMRRPRYHQRIGIRRGPKGDTLWIKVQLPHGGMWKGRHFPPGHALEIKLGRLSSLTWASPCGF